MNAIYKLQKNRVIMYWKSARYIKLLGRTRRKRRKRRKREVCTAEIKHKDTKAQRHKDKISRLKNSHKN